MKNMILAACALSLTHAVAEDAYLFAYFKGERDGLHLAYSRDALKWTALNGNHSILRPTVGKDKLMRDPSICQGPDGTFHMVWTSSWHDRIIGYASSKDLVHWSPQRAIPVMEHEPTARNCWAPEITYDDETGEFYIYWATTIPGRHAPIPGMESRESGLNHRMYLTTTKDFQTFTPTRLWFDPPFSVIDAAIVKVPPAVKSAGGKWMMVVKNENHTPPEKNLRVTFTDHLADGFPTSVSPAINPGAEWVEGPSPLAVGDEIFVYYDVYRNHKYGVVASRDGGKTWEDRSPSLSLPNGMRHGTAFKVDASIVDRLAKETAAPLGGGEKELPGVQGRNVNPDGDEILVTTKCLRFNGRPVVPVMGEMHYSRVPQGEWRDYVRKMKAGGLDIVASYVFWTHHEEKEGVFDFSGNRDLAGFLKICAEEGMKVVLRIGPWAHGECARGGFPEWLVARMRDNPKRLRSTDKEYLGYVERFWRRLGNEVRGNLWHEGGCVVGIQLENECSGPWAYLAALKDMARKAGFDVPFYTRTAWPAMRDAAKYGEVLPLFGGYADGFWERKQTISPGNFSRAFLFPRARTAGIMDKETMPQSASGEKAKAQYPYLTCELGGGMPSAYHRRLQVSPLDTYALALVKLGSGSNMLGYYMYAGGTNPNRPEEGVFFNESQASGYTNNNDLPPFSYEFYAPVSEFGELSPAHGLLKVLNSFCANFAEDFALADVEIIDSHNMRRGPFIFHSDYMRGAATNSVPYIVPSNWKTRFGTIKSATAQPVAWKGGMLVLMKIPGLEPKVEFDGAPFDVEFIDFPPLSAPPDALRGAKAVPFKKVKDAGPAREVSKGARGVAEQPREEDWKEAAAWEVELPEGEERGDFVMEAGYVGDVARVYVDGVPVADDFYKGLPLRCALWRLPEGKVTVRILPWSDSPLIYVQSPFRPKEKTARLDTVRLVPAKRDSAR